MEIRSLPDRRWLERVYLPSLDARVLYVGVESYTTHYRAVAVRASEFHFIDKGHAAIQYGTLGCIHGEFLDYRPTAHYRHIALYGLIGYGSNIEDMHELILHAHGILEAGGTLLLGPDMRPDLSAVLKAESHGVPIPPDLRLRIHQVPPKAYWRALFARKPLDRYDVLADPSSLPDVASNYIWWGRKPQAST